MEEETKRVQAFFRSPTEITAEILMVAKEGAKKSHIAYRTRINLNTFNDYLHQLLAEGFIAGPIGKDNLYKTTEKGEEYLKSYEEIHEVVALTKKE